MADRIEPVIRIPVDPAQVLPLGPQPYRVGGRRVKTVIYVVEQPDLGSSQVITTFTAPLSAAIELRIVERE